MGTIRWGIIGCGDVTEIKSGPGFQKATGSRLVAVMRRDGAKAADYARRHGVPKSYDDAGKLIGDAEVDAVYVATPPGMHETYAMMALSAGKPCYVEKPMSRNAAEARRMTDAFAEGGVPLFIAYYRRAMPRFVKVKEIIDSGQLGELKSVNYVYRDGQMARRVEPPPWRLQAEQSGGGLFLDLGSHALDLLDYFLGPLTNVSGAAKSVRRQYDVEDHVDLTFSNAGGIEGKAEWDFVNEKNEDCFFLHGSDASLRFSCFGSEPIVMERRDRGEQTWEFARPEHVQQPLIQSIVNDLLDVNRPRILLSTGASGLRTQEVMDRALEQFYGTRSDGFWNRKPPSA